MVFSFGSRDKNSRHVYVELVEAFVPAFRIVVSSGRGLEARLGERHFRLRARIDESNSD